MSTTQELITKTKDFNPSNLTYGKPRLGNKGGKTIPVLMNGNKLGGCTDTVKYLQENKLV